MSPAVCPACGSPSTYVRKRDGELCCKTCGHGVKHRGGPEAVQHECPLCQSKQVFFRTNDGTYARRRCGLGQDRGIKGEYLAEMAERVRMEYRETRTAPPCPVCGGSLSLPQGDNVLLCSTCGFNTGLHPALRPSFLASLPPFREIRRGQPAADTPASWSPGGPTLVINGRRLSLKREAGMVWVVVKTSAEGNPVSYQIPVYDANPSSGIDLTDPGFVARTWRLVLARAAAGEEAFWEELPKRFTGMTREVIVSLKKAGLLSQDARETVLAAFRHTMTLRDTPDIGYTAMLFEIGVLDDLEAEQVAVIPLTKRPLTPPAEDDDGIPPGGEENLYYPVPVPDDLPPVDEVQISFDGGKTVWVFVASRLQGRE